MSGVFVYIENRDGQIASASQEALGAAKAIAEELGEDITAVVLGSGVEAVAEAAFALGADEVIGADDEALASYRIEAFGPVLSSMVEEHEPDVLMAGATTEGRDLSAWVAVDTGAGLIADAVDLRVEDERVVATRPVYAGKLLCDAVVEEGLQIITLRSRAFAAAESSDESGDADWADVEIDEIATEVTGESAQKSGVSLTDASIIVSGGRGVGGPEGFDPIRALAEAMGAAVGSSRAAVDAGWIPYEHQVGQTGKTVSPDLYMAFGISGAIQHQAGMRTSKLIVAVNKDSDAPIFGLAHYGIVGDLFDIAPAIEAEFKKRVG